MSKNPGPDGLEAWCVALAACFINFVMAGLGRMSGILFVEFIDIFDTDRLQASVPFSARSLVRNLLGPVVGIIGQKYGVRNATIMGGVIGTVSTAMCFYPYNMLWITILWGVLGGIGTAFTITLPQVILGLHFKKYKTTACGMAFSGGCVGSILFPAVLEYLLHGYGLGGTFLILTGIIMHVIPAAMLLNKPTWIIKESKQSKTIHTKNYNLSKGDTCRMVENREIYVSENSRRKYTEDISADKNGVNLYFHKSYLSELLPLQSALNENIDVKYMINTEFLRSNQNYVIKLLNKVYSTEHAYNSIEKDAVPPLISQFPINTLYNELEGLYKSFEEFKRNDSLTVMKNAGYPPNKCPNVKQRSLNYEASNSNESNQTSDKISFSDENIVPRGMLLLMLSKLLTEEKSVYFQLFPEHEHSNVSIILDQLTQVYSLLKDTKYEEGSPSSLQPQMCTQKYITSNVHLKSNNEIKPATDLRENNTFCTHILTALRLHKNPLFLLISLCRSVHFLTFVPTVTVIVDFSMDKGLLEEDGKYVIAALSIGDLLGRLCLGWVTDREYLSVPRYMLLVMILQGCATCSLPIAESKGIILMVITLFGLLQGSLFVRHPVLVTKYLGKNQQAVAMGSFNFFSGVLGFMVPSYIGYFRDTVGAYNGIFYINGGIGIFVGLLWIFEPVLVKRLQASTREDHVSS